MALLGDILNALDRVKGWKEIQAAPARIDALEKRVATLESALAARPIAQADSCPKCLTGTLQLVSEDAARPPLNHAGIRRRSMACKSEGCGYTTERLIQPDGSPYKVGGR